MIRSRIEVQPNRQRQPCTSPSTWPVNQLTKTFRTQTHSESSSFLIPFHSLAPIPLYRQSKLLPLQHLRIVNPEEIRIKNRLYTPRENCNSIPMSFRPISPDPIRDIQRPVAPQRKQIMRGNRLRLSRSLQQKQLRQYRNGFQPD